MKFRFSQKVSMILAAVLVGSVSIKNVYSQNQPPRGQGGRQQQQGRNSQNRSAGQQPSAATGTNSQNGQPQMPGVMGTIVNGDTTTGQLLVQSPQSTANLVIQVTANTQIMTQVAVTVADLQINDQVMIRDMRQGSNQGQSQGGGSNANASASSGQRPAPPQDNGFRRGGGQQMSGNSANNSQNTNRPNGNGEGQHPPTVGRVTSLSPLTIASDSGDSIMLKLASDARVMKLVSLTFNDLKIGDRIRAMGQTGSNGTFVATQIGVNMDMGQNSRSGSGQNSQQNNGMMRGNQGQRPADGQQGAMPQGRRGQRHNNG